MCLHTWKLFRLSYQWTILYHVNKKITLSRRHIKILNKSTTLVEEGRERMDLKVWIGQNTTNLKEILLFLNWIWRKLEDFLIPICLDVAVANSKENVAVLESRGNNIIILNKM